MAFKFKCPECDALMIGTDAQVGRETQCASCHATLLVPEPPLFEQGDPHPAEDQRPPRGSRASDRDDDRPSRRRDDDDDPRPRRRSRRPPPPPRGFNPLALIGIILGVILLGTCTCCGGGFALLPNEKWHRHTSPTGGFSVELPTPVQKDMAVPGMKADPNTKVEGTIFWRRGEVYLVTHTTIPAAHERNKTDEQLLDEIVREMKSDPEITRVVRNDKITVSGFAAREVEYQDEDGGTYVGRIVIADRRMYMIVAGGRFVRPGAANVRRFLDSFEITDPLLKGGAAFEQKEKEEAVKREAERQAAAERAAREAAHRERENEAFRTAKHTGPAPGDPHALAQTPGDILHLSLEEANAGGIGEWKQTKPLLMGATPGPGVRGNAAFLTKDTKSQEMTIYNDAAVPGPQGRRGFTFSGWYKARHHSFNLFDIMTHYGSSTTSVYMQLRVEEKSIIARSHGRGPATEITAPRPVDDKWHHVAVVFDQTGRDMLVSVYIDGEKVAEGTGDRTDLRYSRMRLGSPKEGADWHPLTDSEGKPRTAVALDVLGAIDECSVIDGPLLAADVRKLAGLDPISPRALKNYGPKVATPFEAADPRKIAGLKNYFSFEESDPLNIRDVVGGKAVLKALDTEFVAGPRGRALRVSVTPQNTIYALRYVEGERYTKSGIGFNEGEPFTLAFWVRTEDDKPGPVTLFHAGGSFWDSPSGYRNLLLWRDRKTSELSFRIHGTGKTLKDNNFDYTCPGGKPNEWTHLAVSRDKDGKYRVWVNGDAREVPGLSRHSSPINYLMLGEGFEDSRVKDKPAYFIELDEICIFDRDLTADELAALAGQKALPKK